MGAAALALVCVLWFFKGTTWAGSVPAQPIAAATAAELTARLKSIQAPVDVEQAGSSTLLFTWRADGRGRVHRARLALDPVKPVVRTTDFITSVNNFAGPEAQHLGWKMLVGAELFRLDPGQKNDRKYPLVVASSTLECPPRGCIG